mgnify:CR=1 FL=1
MKERIDKASLPNQEAGSDTVIGRNPVLELLRSDREVEALFVDGGEKKGSIHKIVAMAKERGIPIKQVTPQKFDAMSGRGNHQGVVALAAAHPYATLEDLFQACGEEPPFFVVADEIEDPHNLGALIRTAEAAGAHGLIIPKRRGVGLTATVAKTSAGAVEHLPVVRVANLASTLKELKERGLWIYGCDMQGQTWCETDFRGPAAIVVGSEGFGMGRLVKEQCDFLVSMPMRGKVNSLNASVAAGIILYEVTRQRLGLTAK